jgi:hypothetical protein
MMKQPAENPNATPLEEQLSIERAVPEPNPPQDFAQIEFEASKLARQREGDEKYTQEEWNRAAEIVRNRKTSLSKA